MSVITALPRLGVGLYEVLKEAEETKGYYFVLLVNGKKVKEYYTYPGAVIEFTLVLRKDGKPVPNHPVRLYINDEPVFSGVTNEEGIARFEKVFNKVGTYEVYGLTVVEEEEKLVGTVLKYLPVVLGVVGGVGAGIAVSRKR